MPGIYLGAGGIKTVTGLYVGAGGVKTVNAVYVGVGGTPQLVWPSWSNGDQIFDEEDFYYWEKYYYSSVTTDWREMGPVNGPDWDFYAGAPSSGDGWYCASVSSINFSSINYLYLYWSGGYLATSTSATTSVTLYCSVSTSRSNLITSDSGVGSVSVTGMYTHNLSAFVPTRNYRNFTIDLRSCSRSGYLKIGWMFQSRSGQFGSDCRGQCRIYEISYYESDPNGYNGTLTVT